MDGLKINWQIIQSEMGMLEGGKQGKERSFEVCEIEGWRKMYYGQKNYLVGPLLVIYL